MGVNQHVPWSCQVTCPQCETACGIEWGEAADHESGYEMSCPTCRCAFQFSRWQYNSYCPDCGLEFVADMHAHQPEFACQVQCAGCGGLIEVVRDGPPIDPELRQPAVRRQSPVKHHRHRAPSSRLPLHPADRSRA